MARTEVDLNPTPCSFEPPDHLAHKGQAAPALSTPTPESFLCFCNLRIKNQIQTYMQNFFCRYRVVNIDTKELTWLLIVHTYP